MESLLRTAALDGSQLTPAVAAIDLPQLCRAVTGRVWLVLDDHPMTCDIPEGTAVAADAALLEHVFENVLTNVAKHTPAGTLVHITAGPGRRAGGPGLGLALTRQIIESHGGRLNVSSTPGEGTTFRFWLPRPAADQSPSG